MSKIVVHYVGNAGSTAVANRNYFESLKNQSSNGRYASSHYIVGLEGEIIQCIPESEIAYASNDANVYSISIENCHANADGKFNSRTTKSLSMLCSDICTRYGLNPITDIIRHFDVNGKRCPLYWVNNSNDFYDFKRKVYEIMKGDKDLVYNTLDEIPIWAKPTIEKLIKKGWLKGSESGLELTETALKVFVVNDRAELYGKE